MEPGWRTAAQLALAIAALALPQGGAGRPLELELELERESARRDEVGAAPDATGQLAAVQQQQHHIADGGGGAGAAEAVAVEAVTAFRREREQSKVVAVPGHLEGAHGAHGARGQGGHGGHGQERSVGSRPVAVKAEKAISLDVRPGPRTLRLPRSRPSRDDYYDDVQVSDLTAALSSAADYFYDDDEVADVAVMRAIVTAPRRKRCPEGERFYERRCRKIW